MTTAPDIFNSTAEERRNYMGLKVVPTMTWSDSRSYSFCNDGVEKGCVVAVGMIGCKHEKKLFLR